MVRLNSWSGVFRHAQWVSDVNLRLSVIFHVISSVIWMKTRSVFSKVFKLRCLSNPAGLEDYSVCTWAPFRDPHRSQGSENPQMIDSTNNFLARKLSFSVSVLAKAGQNKSWKIHILFCKNISKIVPNRSSAQSCSFGWRSDEKFKMEFLSGCFFPKMGLIRFHSDHLNPFRLASLTKLDH